MDKKDTIIFILALGYFFPRLATALGIAYPISTIIEMRRNPVRAEDVRRGITEEVGKPLTEESFQRCLKWMRYIGIVQRE